MNSVSFVPRELFGTNGYYLFPLPFTLDLVRYKEGRKKLNGKWAVASRENSSNHAPLLVL